MYEEIDKGKEVLGEVADAARRLADTRAGWVDRRDAAEFLGQVAAQALDALNAHREEADVDVRITVERALGEASAGLAGVKPNIEAKTYSIEALARACEKPDKRTVEPWKDGYRVEVRLKGGRRQRVYVTPFDTDHGVTLIRIFTYCGKPTPAALHWALKTNMQLHYGALAVIDEDEGEQFVLVNCCIAEETTPREIKASVKELAIYGDWIEQKLTGLDEL